MAARAVAFPDEEVSIISRDILGLTARQAVAISTNGWVNLVDFNGYTTNDIESWIRTVARLAVNRGGVSFPSVRAKRLVALNYWVNRLLLMGRPIIPANFTAAVLIEAVQAYPIADMQTTADDSVKKPELFSYEKWIDWQDSVITFLKGTKNVTKNIPLYYIIRDQPNPILPADMTEDDEVIYHAPHGGIAYNTDNKAVHSFLMEFTNGTDADQWIKEFKHAQDGRGAWLNLCRHYDGPAEGDKRVTVARSDIGLVNYRNESSFSFEKYSTRLRRSFTTLSQYRQPKCEREKVEILLNQITTSDQRLISSIAICRDSHSNTFDNACTYLSQQIAVIYPQHQPNAFGKKGRGGRKPKIRGVYSVKKVNGKATVNGIDVSDTTRYYSDKEFSQLG